MPTLPSFSLTLQTFPNFEERVIWGVAKKPTEKKTGETCAACLLPFSFRAGEKRTTEEEGREKEIVVANGWWCCIEQISLWLNAQVGEGVMWTVLQWTFFILQKWTHTIITLTNNQSNKS